MLLVWVMPVGDTCPLGPTTAMLALTKVAGSIALLNVTVKDEADPSAAGVAVVTIGPLTNTVIVNRNWSPGTSPLTWFWFWFMALPLVSVMFGPRVT